MKIIIVGCGKVGETLVEQLSKEGEDGRQKINKYTRYITVVLAALQGTGIALNYKTMMTNPSTLKVVIAIITLIAGSMFIMWLAEQITQKGISNGSSMIIFVNIISSLPNAITALVGYCKEGKTGILKTVGILVLLFIVIVLIVRVNDGERRLPVQYANKMTGTRFCESEEFSDAGLEQQQFPGSTCHSYSRELPEPETPVTGNQPSRS